MVRHPQVRSQSHLRHQNSSVEPTLYRSDRELLLKSARRKSILIDKSTLPMLAVNYVAGVNSVGGTISRLQRLSRLRSPERGLRNAVP